MSIYKCASKYPPRAKVQILNFDCFLLVLIAALGALTGALGGLTAALGGLPAALRGLTGAFGLGSNFGFLQNRRHRNLQSSINIRQISVEVNNENCRLPYRSLQNSI